MSEKLTPETNMELTAEDSLKILTTVNYLNSLDETKASIWMLQYGNKINNSPEPIKEALFKELDKGVHKGLFNKPIETPVDTSKIANSINTKQGVMSTYAPVDKYKEVRVDFDNSVNKMNSVALQLQLAQDEYDSLASAFAEEEKSMQILIEDKYKDYTPALFTLGLGRKDAFNKVSQENPELSMSLHDKKRNMIKLDEQLGFKKHGEWGARNEAEVTYRHFDIDDSKKPLFIKWREAKADMMRHLDRLNIFEGDSAKTVLPDEWLIDQSYPTLTLEEE